MVVGYGDSRRVWVVCKVVGCVMLGEEGQLSGDVGSVVE